jgi:hypothetical protein
MTMANKVLQFPSQDIIARELRRGGIFVEVKVMHRGETWAGGEIIGGVEVQASRLSAASLVRSALARLGEHFELPGPDSDE